MFIDDFSEASALLSRHRALPKGRFQTEGGVTICHDPEVFSPFLTKVSQFFSASVDQAGKVLDGSVVFEPGTGSGYNLIHQARQHRDLEIYGTDISMAAVKAAQKNLNLNGIRGKIWQASLFNGYNGKPPDVILFNPPLLKVEEAIDDLSPLQRAVFEPSGSLLEDFFRSAGQFQNAVTYIVHTNRQNINPAREDSERVLALATAHKMSCELVGRRDVTYEVYSVYQLRVRKAWAPGSDLK